MEQCLVLINPHESINYTTTRGGIVATGNGHNFKKLFEDPYTEFTFESAEFGRRGLITVNDNNKVLVKGQKRRPDHIGSDFRLRVCYPDHGCCKRI